MIHTASGYGHREGQRVDERRREADMDTRIGSKKAGLEVLTEEQESSLVNQCDRSPQGLGNRVLLVLLLDLGLRVSEATGLQAILLNATVARAGLRHLVDVRIKSRKADCQAH